MSYVKHYYKSEVDAVKTAKKKVNDDWAAVVDMIDYMNAHQVSKTAASKALAGRFGVSVFFLAFFRTN